MDNATEYIKSCSRKDMGREDGNPYGNMWVVGYDIFEIPWVVVKRKKMIMWVVVLAKIEFHVVWLSFLCSFKSNSGGGPFLLNFMGVIT